MRRGTYTWYIIDLEPEDDFEYDDDCEERYHEDDEEKNQIFCVNVELFDASLDVEKYMTSNGFENLNCYDGFNDPIYGIDRQTTQKELELALEEAGLVLKEEEKPPFIQLFYAYDWSISAKEGGPYVVVVTEQYWKKDLCLSETGPLYSDLEMDALKYITSKANLDHLQGFYYKPWHFLNSYIQSEAAKKDSWRGYKMEMKYGLDLKFKKVGMQYNPKLQKFLNSIKK